MAARTTGTQGPALPRGERPARPLSEAEQNIADGIRRLPSRRAQIGTDELALLEQARALGWSWADLGRIYESSGEGTRRRWLILIAKRHADRYDDAQEPTS